MKAPLSIQRVYKRTQKQKEQKRRESRKKKTNKDPTTVENPKHPKKYAKTLYNITSQQPSCFCPK